MTTMQTTRRRMLLGLAAASTAAATGASAAGHTGPQEAPELLALADRLGGALDAYRAAKARVQHIAKTWGPRWPVPDECIVNYGAGCKTHRNILGEGIKTRWGKSDLMDVRSLGTPEYFEAEARSYWAEYERRMTTKSKRGADHARRWSERQAAAIEPARAYWSEADRITEASGIEAAQATLTASRDDLKELVGSIILYREQTVTGLIIKAQAMQAWAEVDAFSRHLHLDALAWSDAMAETVLRQTA